MNRAAFAGAFLAVARFPFAAGRYGAILALQFNLSAPSSQPSFPRASILVARSWLSAAGLIAQVPAHAGTF
jgi:hypothetical protein